MKKPAVISSFLAIGLLAPTFALAGFDNIQSSEGDNLVIALVFGAVLYVLLWASGAVGLLLRWLNSRAKRPSDIIDSICRPLGLLSCIYHSFIIWFFFITPPYRETNDSLYVLITTTLLIISALTAFAPRSWLAKAGPIKKKSQ